jgi:hypothetical protein
MVLLIPAIKTAWRSFFCFAKCITCIFLSSYVCIYKNIVTINEYMHLFIYNVFAHQSNLVSCYLSIYNGWSYIGVSEISFWKRGVWISANSYFDSCISTNHFALLWITSWRY